MLQCKSRAVDQTFPRFLFGCGKSGYRDTIHSTTTIPPRSFYRIASSHETRMKFSTRQIIEDYGTDGSGVIFEVTNHLRTAVAREGGREQRMPP